MAGDFKGVGARRRGWAAQLIPERSGEVAQGPQVLGKPFPVGTPGLSAGCGLRVVVQPRRTASNGARRLVSVVGEARRLVEPRRVAEACPAAHPLEATVELDGAGLCNLLLGEDVQTASCVPFLRRGRHP